MSVKYHYCGIRKKEEFLCDAKPMHSSYKLFIMEGKYYRDGKKYGFFMSLLLWI